MELIGNFHRTLIAATAFGPKSKSVLSKGTYVDSLLNQSKAEASNIFVWERAHNINNQTKDIIILFTKVVECITPIFL
jgi:hypothetical protein